MLRPDARPLLGASRSTVLLLDDEPAIVRALKHAMRSEPFDVKTATTIDAAWAMLAEYPIDVIVSDERMPIMNGSEFLAIARQRYPDAARIILTGHADQAATVRAINDAAVFQYLFKPCAAHEVAKAIHEAIAHQQQNSSGHRASTITESSRTELLDSIDRSWIALQPIVRSSDMSTFAYEALIRSDGALSSAVQLVEAAAAHNETNTLDRAVRKHVALLLDGLPRSVTIFVNIFPVSLLDDDLYDDEAELSHHASRVVFELTERAGIEDVDDVPSRIARLRFHGYRIAIDDLGAGYAALNALSTIEPEVVKFDASLIRGIEASPSRISLVRALIQHCHDNDALSVGECVETAQEAACLTELGCDLLQGYWIGRPVRARSSGLSRKAD